MWNTDRGFTLIEMLAGTIESLECHPRRQNRGVALARHRGADGYGSRTASATKNPSNIVVTAKQK
jgi:hypothetical protein